ncbi:MAG TPA: tyrosine--tRNA ligase [Bellilinea sp.]|nr:tyrosine--tRNA ligase [Bellilinea sp.]
MSPDVFEELKWRGLVYDYVEGVQDLLAREKVTIYNGFDATADSLHIGHMVPLIALARLQRYGHHPIALAGGGTTMIGDPSGKATERKLITREEVEANVDSIKKQLAHFLDFEVQANPARVLNNADWLLNLNLVNFLRDTGKHFTINAMINKDSVKTRLEREEGLSFTEFSYQLMQSYDFLHLYQQEGCKLQTGGSDQWGNITAGVELIRRVAGASAFGMVYPLITKADGSKFGKTESGSVWLSAERTSPYRFHQFWLNTDDRDAIPYLKYFTFLTQDEILELELALATHPEQRDAQRRLAHEMTLTVHGETALAKAEQATQVLFGGSLEGLTIFEIEDIFADVPSYMLQPERLSTDSSTAVDLLVESGMAQSKGEARRAITEGGIYLNNRRVTDPAQVITTDDLLYGRYMVWRRGRKNYHLVKIVG